MPEIDNTIASWPGGEKKTLKSRLENPQFAKFRGFFYFFLFYFRLTKKSTYEKIKLLLVIYLYGIEYF